MGVSVYIMLALTVLAMLGGCRTSPVMSFEQDQPYYANPEEDFFSEPFALQLPETTLPPARGLRTDYTEEAVYLRQIVQLLEQSKILATNARQQVQPQQRKIFNYGAFEIDIDTVIFAIKRYLAADDHTPRGFQALSPTRLNARYSDVE